MNLSRGKATQTFRLTVNTENEAFQEDGAQNAELARVLREIAAKIEAYGNGCVGGLVFDVSGNACGHWSVTR